MRFLRKWKRSRARGEQQGGIRSVTRSRCAALPLGVLAGVVLLPIVVNVRTPAIPAAMTRAVAARHGPITPIDTVKNLDRRTVALGRVLFHDPRLSGGGNTSCSACHDLATNGAFSGPRTNKLDAPTVFNVGFNFRYGWEGRFRTLEGHALATLESRMMSQDVPLATIVQRFRQDSAMRRAFRDAYGRDPDIAAITDAIASFERSLTTPDSRFDRWLAGERRALTQDEEEGYALFRRLGCASCHQGRNVGGNLYQRHGIFRPLTSREPAVVRVPSLRNIAVTAPYFHDGSAPTLESAIERMANAQLNQQLTRDEVRLIATYLHTLTGSHNGKMLTAP